MIVCFAPPPSSLILITEKTASFSPIKHLPDYHQGPVKNKKPIRCKQFPHLHHDILRPSHHLHLSSLHGKHASILTAITNHHNENKTCPLIKPCFSPQHHHDSLILKTRQFSSITTSPISNYTLSNL